MPGLYTEEQFVVVTGVLERFVPPLCQQFGRHRALEMRMEGCVHFLRQESNSR